VIYIITNKQNGKRYIGKTSRTLEKRWYYHCKESEYGSNTHLHRAIRKYGVSNFIIEKLCDGLDEEEVKMISFYTPEYNMTKGGDGGDTSQSINYKTAMARRSYKGSNNPMYGKRGKDNPNYGKKYGPNPKASLLKKKRLLSSDGNKFLGFQAMFDFYNVKSYYSLRKKGIYWSEIKDEHKK